MRLAILAKLLTEVGDVDLDRSWVVVVGRIVTPDGLKQVGNAENTPALPDQDGQQVEFLDSVSGARPRRQRPGRTQPDPYSKKPRAALPRVSIVSRRDACLQCV